MLELLAAGSVFFSGLYVVFKRCLKQVPCLQWDEGDAVTVSARHWLTSSYILFAVPYFIYDIYAMFLCHCHKLQVKGHEGSGVSSALLLSYLRKEFLMVLHHVVMGCVLIGR
ncbi:Protein FAM57B [Acipenser ruthenus]|uniref:Protein FAM57B n=1 Tax=Acipenser ruthenus TaxID=7906 RepID=A0A444V028_ACIRT|nr:Protein FAM57B [Acipenser ruthenus]